MSEQEIIEGNKLIAEFMGLRQIPINLYGNEKCYYFYFPSSDNYELTQEEIQKESFDILNYAWSIYNLSYHLSWDWLMPVVEKIWKIVNNRESIFYFETFEGHLIAPIKNTGSNIVDCWLACVVFIKWYNSCQK